MSRRGVAVGGVVALVAGVLFAVGPRPAVDTDVQPPDLPDGPLPAALEAYLARAEARFDDLRPGTEKTIVWADTLDRRRTRLSLVYLHGFSATRREVSPLTERIAAELGANLFLTRLTGHGRGGEALAGATVKDWLTDAVHAFEIARRLGERVVVVGTSTGATLATWLAHRWATAGDAEGRSAGDGEGRSADEGEDTAPPDGRLKRDGKLAALILLSPNFGLRDWRSRILTWPWGKQIARLVQGRYRSFDPENEDHARFWTTRYPTDALVPMMALVNLVADLNVSAINTPVMVAYSEDDDVIDPGAVARRVSEFGAAVRQATIVGDVEDPARHVLAGDILSPSGTGRLAAEIVEFVRRAILEGEMLADAALEDCH